MNRYYFRISDKLGHLSNDYITVIGEDLKDARSIATDYAKENGIKYRMTPIMEELVSDNYITVSKDDVTKSKGKDKKKYQHDYEKSAFTPLEQSYFVYAVIWAFLIAAGWWLSQHIGFFDFSSII